MNCPQRGSKQRATPRCAPAHRKCRISSLRILVVDDSVVTRRVLGTILRSRHWTVCGEAEDGSSGVKKFHELKPDLVLLDLAMPDMDGIEAARLMSGSDATVPIILFTVLDLEGLETRAYDAGICAVVSKAQGWNLLKSIETAITQSSRELRRASRYPVCRYRTSAKCDWRTIRLRARPEYCRSLPRNAQSVLHKCFDPNHNQYAKGVLPS